MILKKITIFLISIIICLATFCAVGCSTSSVDKDDTAIIMNKAITKIDDFNETLFSVVKTQDQPESANTLSRIKHYRSIEPDHIIAPRSVGDAISRQMNIKYVYEIVNYVLQMSRKNKDYKNKFNVSETYYGTARKTISGPLNELFESPNVPDPVLTIQATRDKYCLNFSADWDWRNQYLEQNLPAYNVVICTNGQIEYDQNKKDVKKIRMNWFWEYGNSEFMSSFFDFENDEFYFMSTYNSGQYHPGIESFATYYNNGTLCPQTIVEQRNNGAWVVKSNITTDASNLNYQAYEYTDYNTSTEGTLYEGFEENRNNYERLFSEIYNKVKVLPLRTEKDFIVRTENSIQIDYMDDAAIYGINKSRIIANDKGATYLYLEKTDMENIFDKLYSSSAVINDVSAIAFVANAEQSFNNVKDSYIGELGSYAGVKYTLAYEHDGYDWDNWILFCNNFRYKITSETESIAFEYNNGIVSNVVYAQN